MRLTKILSVSLLMAFSGFSHAVKVDEIINTYHENIGGEKALKSLKGIKMVGEVDNGTFKIPMEQVTVADGKQFLKFKVQGKELHQNTFDGTVMWSTNFQTMKAEKGDPDAAYNLKQELADFQSPFLDYKKKGYQVELVGTEVMDGSETYKVKLTRKPKKVEGKMVPNISFFYFDQEAMVPIAVENEIVQGPAKGSKQKIKFSDYQEVQGLYFPFSITTSVGAREIPFALKTVELNPKVTDADFAFPKVANE